MAENAFKSHPIIQYRPEESKLVLVYRPIEHVSLPDIAELGAALVQYSKLELTIFFYIREPEVESETGLEYYKGHVERVNDIKMIVSWLNQFTAVREIMVGISSSDRVHSQLKLMGGLWALNHWNRTKMIYMFGKEKGQLEKLLIKNLNEKPGHPWLHWIMLNWFDVLEFHKNLDVPSRQFAGTWDGERCHAIYRGLHPNCIKVYWQLEAFHCSYPPKDKVCRTGGICGTLEDWKHDLFSVPPGDNSWQSGAQEEENKD
jgi:hypothetical protein